MIALLCPTRGRPAQYKRMCDSAFATSTKGNVGIIDGTNGADIYSTKHYSLDCPTVYMWNDLAVEAMQYEKTNLFMLASDDIIFATPGWDKALIDHYHALENKIHVYHLQDSRDPEGAPHPVVTREYMDAMGYFMPPLFLHWYVDTWTREIAKANGVFTHLRNYELIHDKPSDKGKPDETHNHIRTMGWHQRDGAVNQTCRHFLEFEKKRLATHMVNDFMGADC